MASVPKCGPRNFGGGSHFEVLGRISIGVRRLKTRVLKTRLFIVLFFFLYHFKTPPPQSVNRTASFQPIILAASHKKYKQFGAVNTKLQNGLVSTLRSRTPVFYRSLQKESKNSALFIAQCFLICPRLTCSLASPLWLNNYLT